MTLKEKKQMIVGAIRMLEDKLVALKHCYDGIKSPQERDAEIDVLQEHLRCAHSVLVMLNEEEMKENAA